MILLIIFVYAVLKIIPDLTKMWKAERDRDWNDRKERQQTNDELLREVVSAVTTSNHALDTIEKTVDQLSKELAKRPCINPDPKSNVSERRDDV